MKTSLFSLKRFLRIGHSLTAQQVRILLEDPAIKWSTTVFFFPTVPSGNTFLRLYETKNSQN